ncbi:MAG: hypothetical protein KA794_20605, partial [Candidatus Obscuribacter sp.]|nr:hypothetical protein [Candidatus Obscuribacter sp.]
REGIHFVINQQPPDGWNVSAYSTISNVRVVTWCNGSYTVLDSLENYSKHVGSEYDRILVDEFQNVTPDARRFLLGRMRGKAFERARYKHQMFYALTPPEQPMALQHLVDLIDKFKDNEKQIKFVRGSTYLNKQNLPDDYI